MAHSFATCSGRLQNVTGLVAVTLPRLVRADVVNFNMLVRCLFVRHPPRAFSGLAGQPPTAHGLLPDANWNDLGVEIRSISLPGCVLSGRILTALCHAGPAAIFPPARSRRDFHYQRRQVPERAVAGEPLNGGVAPSGALLFSDCLPRCLRAWAPPRCTVDAG